MEHGASSPGSSRNVVRTHLGGPLDCSVYKVMFFNKFAGLLFNQVISAIRFRKMSEFWAETSFFYSIYSCLFGGRVACISHHPPPLPNLSISIQGFECVLYARPFFEQIVCSIPLQSNLGLAFEVGLFEKESILIVKVLTFLLGQCRPFCWDRLLAYGPHT